MDQWYRTETDSVVVFNDEFRDLVKAGGMNEEGKGFVTNGDIDLTQLFYNCIGMPQRNYTADSPGDNVQYLVCHDGLTLHDCIAYNVGLDERIPAQKKELIARIKVGNALALTCQGIRSGGGVSRMCTARRKNAPALLYGTAMTLRTA